MTDLFGSGTTSSEATTTTKTKKDVPPGTPPPQTELHGDGKVEGSEATVANTGNKLEQEGVLSAWTKDLLNEGGSAWTGFKSLFSSSSSTDTTASTGQAGTGSDNNSGGQFQHVDDIRHITFDSVFGTTDATTDKPAPPATTNGAAESSLSSWVSNMEKSLGGNNVNADMKSGFDWLFQTKSGDTTKEMGQQNGVDHVKERNGDGVTTDINATKTEIKGIVGDASILQNKDTKETHYKSADGQYTVDVNGDVKTVTDNNGQQFTWNSKTQTGEILGKDGKPLMNFDSAGDLTQQLTATTKITQTNGDAAATADAMQQQQQASGKQPQDTRYIADSHGNYAILRKDGLMIKTWKESGEVLLEKDHHEIKVLDGHASALVKGDDGRGHWVPLKNDELPAGMQVKSDGSVVVDGKTVVDKSGNVQADSNTTVNTKAGNLTTASDTGTVHATNTDGTKTTVAHAGTGTITNDGSGFVNTDPKTQKIFHDWHPHDHCMDVFDGPGKSGIHLDTQPDGPMVITESNGQATTIRPDGFIASYDPKGSFLFGTDTAGNSFFGDGTEIGADGTISDQYGTSGSAWDSSDEASQDAPADQEIADADSALSMAGGAVASYAADPGDLAALSTEESDLSSLATMYTASGDLDVVARLNATLASVEAEKTQLQQRVDVADASGGITGDSNPALTKMVLESGLPPDVALKRLAEQGVIKPYNPDDPESNTNAA